MILIGFFLQIQSTDCSSAKNDQQRRNACLARNDVITDADKTFEVQNYNVIQDPITESIKDRFLAGGTVYADFSRLDSRNFCDIINHRFQIPALVELNNRLQKFDKEAPAENLRYEFTSFAMHWDKCVR